MYKLSLYNSNVETVVHYPSANQDDPHVGKLPLKEGLSMVDTLSFTMYPTNPGYNNVFELVTRVKIFDLRDDNVRFTGRVLDVSEKMDNDGKIYKDVTCEGALSILNDTKQRGSSFYADTIADFLTQILTVHNSKVDSSKQIYVGNVNIAGNVIHSCNYGTTLAEILEVREQVGGDIRVREVNGILYMDWLYYFDSSNVELSLGVNMKDMIRSKDVTSLGTRIVPLGANNLTIESVNGGIDYIEDTTARSVYGIIEKTVEFKDIEDASVLRSTCIANLSTYTQPSYILESGALDLSFISGVKTDQFVLGKTLNIINRFMGVNDAYKIVQLDLDLLQPYNPKLTIANRPVTLSNTINDLRKETIQNDGVYNNVQIGRSFGIRAVRSDNKVRTTINATDGISIENETKKVFYVDINGKLVAVDIIAEGGTFDNITSEGGTFNNITATGGTFDNIEVINGINITDGDAACTIGFNGITLTKGTNSSTMQVKSNSEGNGTAVEFNDDVIILKKFDVLAHTHMKSLTVGTYATVYGTLDCQTNFKVFDTADFLGDVNIGDDTLKQYIQKVVAGTI